MLPIIEQGESLLLHIILGILSNLLTVYSQKNITYLSQVWYNTPYAYFLKRSIFTETSPSLILTPNELLAYIEYLGKNSIHIGLTCGFNHEQTIEASQELDYFMLLF